MAFSSYPDATRRTRRITHFLPDVPDRQHKKSTKQGCYLMLITKIKSEIYDSASFNP